MVLPFFDPSWDVCRQKCQDRRIAFWSSHLASCGMRHDLTPHQNAVGISSHLHDFDKESLVCHCCHIEQRQRPTAPVTHR